MELRVVALPEGSDPAELVVGQGPAAFERLLSAAISVPEFEAARVLDAADLTTTHGRDRALELVRPLVASTPERSIVRDELVRRVTDRLEVPPSYVTGSTGGGGGRPAPSTANGRGDGAPREGSPAAGRDAPAPPRRSPPAPAERAERAFLAMCLGQPTLGRELLERAGGGHLSARFAPVREHLLDHPDDPLAELPADEEQAALVTEIAMLAEAEPSTELDVRLSFLQLEIQRVNRGLRAATRDRDYERQRELLAERERFRAEFDELMGTVG
jgi:DNA primase